MAEARFAADPSDGGPPGQGRVIAGVAAGVVVLALLGFGVGWLAFHGDDPVHAAPPPVVVAPSVSAGPATPAGALPDYAGQDFATVRAALRGRQLGVRLFFGTGAGGAVLRTEPAAGAVPGRGQTVKVYVAGPAPELTLPAVTGRPCNDGGRALADAGLYPRYPTGRAGLVVRVETATPAVRWNDTVTVVCARPGSTPSPVPTAAPDPSDPDASPPPEPTTSASPSAGVV